MDKKILIIEDEIGIANAFKKQLILKGGFEIDLALGGAEGIEKMKSQKYDLVFLDLIMPDIDGLTVLETVSAHRKRYNNPSIIILTNVTSTDLQRELKKHKIINFIIKTDVDIETVVDNFFISSSD